MEPQKAIQKPPAIAPTRRQLLNNQHFEDVSRLVDIAVGATATMCWTQRVYWACGHEVNSPEEQEIIYCTEARARYENAHEDRERE